ncbi:response regulator receiver protein [Parvibaculum lavamentivorans DS-1]|uniref:Response regulator receiver protein n=1 Tax=Parvibaculum lavamentivorans (strain DS-1 / DSM 13023 / NCIMB 13966) TaxID=402881 RepID=A7HVQ7_PARL1|nr:response regulator [Parvibaculum lavamentivorans]ABS63990.1 response regulator receiver protein [Parvibaculum lavamentivorans DS-1]
MSDTEVCVLIIDDDLAMRESLESLFRSLGHEARAFATGRELVESDLPDMPSCLVLDVRLPGASGLELQLELLRLGFDLPIVFITGHGDVPMSVAAMKAGAIEFLTKPFREQELIDAVHRGVEIDRERRAALTSLAELRSRFETLTPREREIIALVVTGQMNKQIAAELNLSEVTVKVHRAQVMRKMQAKTLPDLVRYADRLLTDTSKP